VCKYELKKDKWKKCPFMPIHGVHLCMESNPPCSAVTDPLLKEAQMECWYLISHGHVQMLVVVGLNFKFFICPVFFNKKMIVINQRQIKFGTTVLTSVLYQRKYDTLGIEVQKKGNKTTGIGHIRQGHHMIRNE
jgi:hypothetical protein